MNTPDQNYQSRSDTGPDVASSASSALIPDPDWQSIRNTRGLSRLVAFTERQFEHINAWLDEQVSYRKIAEYCRTEWQREVPHMTIARYAKRRVALVLAADLEDSKVAAAEISQYAATGDASFSTNTLELLEQQAFDLAAVYQRDSDAADLDTIQQLTSIINKARNTKVRERHATVQENKLELRREELALKREIHQARFASKNSDVLTNNGDASCFEHHNNGGTRSPSPTSNSRDAIGSPDAASADLTSANAETPAAPVKPSKRFPTPNPLPYEIYLKNCAYTEKLLAGLVDPLTGEELPDPNNSSFPRPLGGPQFAERTSLNGELTCGGLGKPLGQGEGVSPVAVAESTINPPLSPFSPVQNSNGGAL